MNTCIRRLGSSIIRLGLLALLALLALYPPGPYRTLALAAEDQGAPTPQQSGQIFLPLVRGGGAAPDLRFTPDTVALAPGATVNIAVRVEPQADLRGATFDLPGVQDGVNSRFEAAADGQSGTLTIVASAALEADDRALTVQGRSGVGTGTWVGALKVTTTGTLTAKTIFVDAVNGKDSNDGTQTKPFKTLGKALTVALAGDMVKLLPGVYGALSFGSGDAFPVLVPNGVTIAGTRAANGAQQSFLSTSGGTTDDLALSFAGDATIKDLELDVFDTAISANKGKLTLSNLNFILNRTNVALTGTAQATLNSVFMFVGSERRALSLIQQAQIKLSETTITSEPGCGTSTPALELYDAGQVTFVNNVVIEDYPGTALFLHGTSKASGLVRMTRTIPASCTFSQFPLVRGVESASLNLNGGELGAQGGAETDGIQWQSTGPLTLRTSVHGFTRFGVDLLADATLTVNDSDFHSIKNVAINVFEHPRATLTINNTSFVANRTGIQAANFKLRNSRFQVNQFGLFLRGNGADIGTASSPGNNDFRDNGTGFVFNNQVLGAVVNASGNTWNPNVQGADSQGHYISGLEIGGTNPNAQGTNFKLPSTGAVIQF
jgi:hypothetical protein